MANTVERSGPWTLRAALGAVGSVIALMVVSLVGVVAPVERQRVEDEWNDRLTRRADSLLQGVARWLGDLQADAAVVATYPSAVHQVSGSPANRPLPEGVGPHEHVAQLLESARAAHGDTRVLVADHGGRVVVGAGDPASAVHAPLLSEALASRRASTAFYRDGDRPRVAVAHPVWTAGASEPVGAVLVEADPEAWLYPELQREASSTSTAETLLVERRGDRVHFLSPLRHDAAPVLTVERPLSAADLAAAQALAGRSAFGEFVDYRGARVWAAVRLLPQGPWGVIAKVDCDEALQAYRTRMRIWWWSAVLVLAAFLGLAYGAWRHAESVAAAAFARGLGRLGGTLDLMREALFAVDRTDDGWRIREVWGDTVNLYGRPHAWFRNQRPSALRDPECAATADGDLDRAWEQGGLVYETRHQRADGSCFAAEIVAQRADGGTVLTLARDVTARHETEGRLRSALQALRQSEERFRKLADNARDLIYLYRVQPEPAVEYLSPAIESLTGRELREFHDDPSLWARIVHPDDRAVHERIVRGDFGDDPVVLRWLHADGRTLWTEHRLTAIRGAGGLAAVEGIARDVTDRVTAEQALGTVLRAVEHSPTPVMITDTAGRIEYVNPSFASVTGYPREEAIGQNPRILKSGRMAPEVYLGMWEALTAGREWSGELLNRRKDGSLVWVSASISPVPDPSGRTTHYVAVQEDITERRLAAEKLAAAQQQLLQAQKMDAIGRLAGGVAHDFNNLLGVMIGHAELLRRGATDEQKVRLQQLLAAAQRAAGLTRQLLAFSRQQVVEPRVLDLNALLAALEMMLGRLIGEDVALVLVPGADLGRVRIDPGQLEQVVLNLCVNARDAMPDGGLLRLETANVEIDASAPAARHAMSPGRYVSLTVTDSGHGMPAEVLDHVFEPFFTTKEQGKGKGLGLATAYGIVKQAAGYVWAESEVGHGSTLRIYLPRVDAPVEPEDDRADTAPRGAAETILLVEDEAPLREIVREMLEESGYRVLEADSGARAIDIAVERVGEIDLLLTDVVMPGMNGRELAEALRGTRPTLRVLYMSGYTDDVIATRGVLKPGTLLLQKPFTGARLLSRVCEALDQRDTAAG